MSAPLAPALRALWAGDPAPMAARLLHRTRMTDALVERVGRSSVLAGLADAGSDPGVALELAGGGWHILRLAGAGERHLWARMEGERALELVLVRGRTGEPDPATAEAMGLARPTHRPLGELASGAGQLGPPPDDAGLPPALRMLVLLNARCLDGRMAGAGLRWTAPDGVEGDGADERRWWQAVWRMVPDAVLTPVHAIADGSEVAVLWQMQGHVAGRRVSLPGSSLLRLDGAAIGAGWLAFDLLALAATGHRLFFPD